MSLCGTLEQTKTIHFRAYDNRERDHAELVALIHVGQESRYLPITTVGNESYVYEFDFSHDQRGVGVLEVFINDEQIPESPFRVDVISRDCDTDYPGQNKAPVSVIRSLP